MKRPASPEACMVCMLTHCEGGYWHLFPWTPLSVLRQDHPPICQGRQYTFGDTICAARWVNVKTGEQGVYDFVIEEKFPGCSPWREW